MARVEKFLADQVARAPLSTALSDSTGVVWTFADLDAASDVLAAELQDAGVQANDRVLLLAENCAAAVAALHAAWKLGAVIIPFNARQTEGEVQKILNHATPAAVLMTSAVSGDAARHAERMEAREITGMFGTVHIATPGPSNPDDDLHDVAVLLYTTGTTGDPKGVMLTHSGMRFGGQASAALRSMTHDDVIYGALPMSHVFGLVSVITAACFAGTHVRLEARFSAQKLFEAAHDGVTIIPAVPQMHALVMQYTKEKGLDRLGSPSLRYVSSGGAPLDPAWKRKAEAFYELPLQNGFGMTETTSGASATVNAIGSPDTSVGPVTPGTEAMIDETVPGGGEGQGEVLIRGPHVMKGYYRNPAETAKAVDADGWLHTGDLGKIDAEGRLHILGRSKELIIHGGFNVYPPEVEAALNDHPQVIQSAVIGRMKDGDEEVLAFVQVAEGDIPDAEELRAFVKERLAGYKRPSQIIVGTSLPAAPTGKILKHRLLDAFADQIRD
ncbi:class I adenylate-forming enzyme family protein [Sulfitobacter sp. PR48]|uniref:class I adenylate-forming enzyme family protein n=1 Tax=Sulfitobacter sp. PR48 TaxID=3028383 RepID=UPI00237A6B68|nr:class I adenylate-forming enzyme family protein [Sulfitobacter sp. PR48]MDD9720378.1 class I adenylate-forming enzyme family protein [Sulfitobacter sp. PR48]